MAKPLVPPTGNLIGPPDPSRRDTDVEAALAAVASRATPLARRLGLDAREVDRLLEVTTARGTSGDAAFASPDECGAWFERALGPLAVNGPRKDRSAFFTPPTLADALVAHALTDESADDAVPSVLDPSAGAGAMMLAVLRSSLRRQLAPAARIAAQLFAVELDPAAARLCRLALWLECGDPDLDPSVFEHTVRCGNALLMPPASRSWTPDEREALDALSHDRALSAWPEIANGVDVVIGNPPWQTLKPDSRAFFGQVDPGYRARGKQEALRVQRDLCAREPEIRAAWERTLARHAAFATFCRTRFRLQGRAGDPNLYKLFVEWGLDAIRDGGRLAMLVPSGLHSDLGARELRAALLDEHRWQTLCGFENRERLFPDVDGRFKFDAIVVAKGGSTDRVSVAFMRRTPDAKLIETANPLRIDRATLARLSPRSRAFPEVRSREELRLLERIHADSVPFGDPGSRGWRLTFRRELDMTLDSARFATRDELAKRGLLPDRHGRWLEVRRARDDSGGSFDPEILPLADGREVLRSDVGEAWVPVWEGRMVDVFEPAAKTWLSGRGRRARWAERNGEARIGSQFLVPAAELMRVDGCPGTPKIGFLAVGSATNSRTMIATALVRAACGNSVPTIRSSRGPRATLALCAVLCSLAYDHALRTRLSGTNLNRFALDETPLPKPGRLLSIASLPGIVATLCWRLPAFAEGWCALRGDDRKIAIHPSVVPTPDHTRRARRAAMDAIIAAAYGLDASDLAGIAADTWRPSAQLRARSTNRSFDPKGFWRVDRQLPPGRRLPVLAVAARHDFDARLRGVTNDSDWSRAADAFLTTWQPPEALDLRKLGFDGATSGSVAVGLETQAETAVNRKDAWRLCELEARRARAFDA